MRRCSSQIITAPCADDSGIINIDPAKGALLHADPLRVSDSALRTASPSRPSPQVCHGFAVATGGASRRVWLATCAEPFASGFFSFQPPKKQRGSSERRGADASTLVTEIKRPEKRKNEIEHSLGRRSIETGFAGRSKRSSRKCGGSRGRGDHAGFLRASRISNRRALCLPPDVLPALSSVSV